MKNQLKILIVSPQTIVPPKHGATIRIYNLVKQIAKTFNVALITSQSKKEIVKD